MSQPTQIVDQFGRVHDYLRISLTERCNLHCTYCMPEEGIELRDRSHFMSTEEIVAIAKTFVNLGVNKIRLTGGEPLIKKDIRNIILQLSELPIELTLTTNAILIDRHIELLKEAGIKSLNVSIDSLQEEKFNQITRRKDFLRIRKNIDLLIENKFDVKLNIVLMKGVNDDEINDFINWSVKEPISVRFIEFMPFDGNNWNWEKKVSFQTIMEQVEQHFGASKIFQLESHPNATSRNFKIDGAKGKFGIISTVTNPFCDSCNRIRLTADGKIKNCLFSNNELDLLTAFRNGNDIQPLILDSIYNKDKSRGGLDSFEGNSTDQLKNRPMISIGG